MTITVLDSVRLMTEILDAPAADRADLIRAMWQPLAPMYRFIPGGLDLADAGAGAARFAAEALRRYAGEH